MWSKSFSSEPTKSHFNELKNWKLELTDAGAPVKQCLKYISNENWIDRTALCVLRYLSVYWTLFRHYLGGSRIRAGTKVSLCLTRWVQQCYQTLEYRLGIQTRTQTLWHGTDWAELSLHRFGFCSALWKFRCILFTFFSPFQKTPSIMAFITLNVACLAIDG